MEEAEGARRCSAFPLSFGRLIGFPVREYTSHYEALVYGKGALFFATLRDKLGAQRFDTLLRTHLERYRWRIATPAEFQALVEEVAGRDMYGLLNEWVCGNQIASQQRSTKWLRTASLH